MAFPQRDISRLMRGLRTSHNCKWNPADGLLWICLKRWMEERLGHGL